MNLAFEEKDPGTAYVQDNVLLPKKGIHVAPIKAALTFVFGEEEVRNELGDLLRTRAGELRLWDETKHHLIVPRDFIPRNQYHNFNFDFVDNRPPPRDFETVDLKDKIKLRDEDQVEAFEALLKNDSGTLNLACGKGKTVLSLKLAAKLKVPTIIVVNNTALLSQWKDEIVQHLGLDESEIGIIQGDRVQWEGYSIVIAMLHTLSLRRGTWGMDFRERFGLAFYDEGHHMSAPVFVQGADLFFGKRFSLTATAQRTDGLEMVYQYHLGRIIHSNLEQELIPTTVFHKLKWEMPDGDKHLVSDVRGDLNLSRIRSYLGSLDWRNQLIYEDLLFDLSKGRQILVLSHSVDHVNRVAEMFYGAGQFNAGVITGSTPQDDRMGILRNSNPVMGTFQLAREGLNKPQLDTLYVLTPFSNRNDLQQAWGRIQRIYDNKLEPLVRVYEDHALKPCMGTARKLRSFLKELRYPVKAKTIGVET